MSSLKKWRVYPESIGWSSLANWGVGSNDVDDDDDDDDVNDDDNNEVAQSKRALYTSSSGQHAFLSFNFFCTE